MTPRAAGSFRIAQAELHYTPLGGTEQVVKQDVLLEFTNDPNTAKYDPRVMNLVEKVTAFKLQTRALSEAEAGKRGASNACVATFSFQAPAFYRKLGYRQFGKPAGFPRGRDWIWLAKAL